MSSTSATRRELSLEPGLTLSEVSGLVADGYAHLPPSQRDELSVALHTFLEVIQEDDLVVTMTEEQLITGTIDDAAAHEERTLSSLLTRPVLWSKVADAVGGTPGQAQRRPRTGGSRR